MDFFFWLTSGVWLCFIYCCWSTVLLSSSFQAQRQYMTIWLRETIPLWEASLRVTPPESRGSGYESKQFTLSEPRLTLAGLKIDHSSTAHLLTQNWPWKAVLIFQQRKTVKLLDSSKLSRAACSVRTTMGTWVIHWLLCTCLIKCPLLRSRITKLLWRTCALGYLSI